MTIADVTKSRLKSLNIPPALWSNVVMLVETKASSDKVRDAVLQMHKDVANYFIPGVD